jgi:hypothetical protein
MEGVDSALKNMIKTGKLRHHRAGSFTFGQCINFFTYFWRDQGDGQVLKDNELLGGTTQYRYGIGRTQQEHLFKPGGKDSYST